MFMMNNWSQLIGSKVELFLVDECKRNGLVLSRRKRATATSFLLVPSMLIAGMCSDAT